MKTALSFALTLAALGAVPGSAQQPAARAAARPAPSPEARKDSDERNLRISFKIKAQDLEGAGNFTVRNRSQGNYVIGGELPFETEMAQGKTVDFKKTGVIVNCLPGALSDDLFSLACQFELSGPGRPTGSLQARPVLTFQFQSEFLLRKGRTLVLVDELARRIEVKLDEVPL